MTANQLFNQIQANILGRSIVCSKMTEISGWGAAIAAGIGSKQIKLEKIDNHPKTILYQPKLKKEDRESELKRWKEAVRRSMNWAEEAVRRGGHKLNHN